jgi:hypothetical protein
MWTYYLLSVFFPSFMLRSLYAEGSSLDSKAIEKYATRTRRRPRFLRGVSNR